METLDSDKDQAHPYKGYLNRALHISSAYDDELFGDLPSRHPNDQHQNQLHNHIHQHQHHLHHSLAPPQLSNNNSESNISSSGSFDFNVNGNLKSPKFDNNSSMNVLVDLEDPSIGGKSRELLDSIAPTEPEVAPIPVQVDQLTTKPMNQGKLHESESEEWAAVKKVTDPDDSSKYKIIKRSVLDFKFGKSLGEGSYSTVVLATDKHTQQKYAVKILDKRHIIKEKKVKYVNIEKHALNRLIDRIGIISLYFTFQDKQSLYFVLDYASNGELLTLIKKYGTLNEDCTRHYGAQLLDAIKYMHDNGVIHRDIKPENILLDDKMRLQVTDFGTARLLEKRAKTGANPEDSDLEDYPVDVRAKSFVGTAEYVSPELLESKYCGKPGDIWAFGCIIYQMIAGKPPFKGLNEYQTFQKITKLQYAFSAGFPVIIRDLLKQILVLQPSKRATIPQIQQHYFFQSVKWNDFDLIWSVKHPEIGPYKMNAKSMMKVPELAKNQPIPATPAQAQAQAKKSASKKYGAPPASSTGKVSAASVAAYVLNKNDSDNDSNGEDDTDYSPSNTTAGSSSSSNKVISRPTSSRKSSAPVAKPRPAADYIPGTNILRPTVNSQAIRTLTSTHRKNQSSSSSTSSKKSKVLEVTPITPIENAWSSYLHHKDERILKIGPVICHKQPTDVFEKKHKGLLHDSPLGWYGTKQGNGSARPPTSLLTQVVNGSQGLRGGASTAEEGVEYDEDDAIIDHYSMSVQPKRASSSASNSSSKDRNSTSSGSSSSNKGSKSSLFKKLLLSSHNNNEEEGGYNGDFFSTSSSSSSHPLEKLKTCTMLITTHGRVLLFLRDDNLTNYKMIAELRLNFPFIHFKEVISAGSTKFLLKIIPTMGVFAIESCVTTYIFEVEKFDVKLWTESLARAKLNQQEREYEEQNGISYPQTTTGNISTNTTTPSNGNNTQRAVSKSSPTIQQQAFTASSPSNASGTGTKSASTSPYIGSNSSSSPRMKSPEPSTKTRESSSNGGSSATSSTAGGLLTNRMTKSIKRKPPPPVYPSSSTNGGINLSTGLPSSPTGHGYGNGTLYAAQKAVSDNNEKNRHSGEYKQRSSFSKDTSSNNASSRAANIVKNFMPAHESYNSSSGGKPAITSLNSKFLSRSHRKK